MAVNKVVYSGDTLMDLTSDTVTSENLDEGITAHNSAGESIVGIRRVVDVLPIENGGTGATTAAAARTNLGVAAANHGHTASDITSGTLSGQVKANAVAAASVTVAQVRSINAGTEDMTAGTTALNTGEIYFVYE